LVLLLLIAAAPSVDGYGGRAQGDGAPADDGFRLVARILPGEWIELADVGGVPTAAAPDAGDPATPSPVMETLSGAALVEALRGGGHVIYFRHAATDFSQQDTNRQNLADCASQRNLDDAGRADARRIGEGFAALGIPVGQVLSSEYCRTRETAELAFGRVTPTIDLTSVFAAAETDDDEARMAALRRLLATPPEPGTNTVLVGHQANLADAAGVVIAEGEAAIFLPLPTEEGVATSATDDA
jgi:phosphohistidine phosphatase SixA